MSTKRKEETGRADGATTPSRKSVQLVRDWLWLSPTRETDGLPWDGKYIRDAARPGVGNNQNASAGGAR